MIEPEMAFADLDDDMFVAEAMLKYVIKDLRLFFENDIRFLEQFTAAI